MHLAQDDANVAAILNPDGSVNEAKVAMLRHTMLHSGPAPSRGDFDIHGYPRAHPELRDRDGRPLPQGVRAPPTGLPFHMQPQHGRGPPHMDGGPGPRWGDDFRRGDGGGPSMNLAPSHGPGMGHWDIPPASGLPAVGHGHYMPRPGPGDDPLGFDGRRLGGLGDRDRERERDRDMNRRPPGGPGGPPLGTGPLGDAMGGPPRKRFPTTKAATPCRFVFTAKGCQFGDKCAFSHAPPADGMMLPPPRMGMGPGMGPGMGGPGLGPDGGPDDRRGARRRREESSLDEFGRERRSRM